MAHMETIKQMSMKVWHGSGGDYQTDEQAGVEQLGWRLSGRRSGRCRAVQVAYIKQMSRQVSCGSAGDNQADEQEGVTRMRWRLSSR